MGTNEKGTPQSRTYTVNDIAAILGIGRASAYKLANSGLFKTIRIGNMIRISRKSFEDWLKMEEQKYLFSKSSNGALRSRDNKTGFKILSNSIP